MSVTALYFWAEWCAPCKFVSPTIQSVVDEFDDVELVKRDADLHADLMQDFEVRSIPTVIVMAEDEEIVRIVGAKPPATYRKALERALGS